MKCVAAINLTKPSSPKRKLVENLLVIHVKNQTDTTRTQAKSAVMCKVRRLATICFYYIKWCASAEKARTS